MARRVIGIGLDGLEPSIVESLWAAGDLPNLRRLRDQGGFSRVATTCPAQTPVAWSTFATGVNPGGHGIFDFIRRDPRTYVPDFSLNRFEQRSAYLPPRAVNLRRGTPVWQRLASKGIPSVVLRCPCTFPPDEQCGRMLSGMGVPDMRGGLGTSAFYTSRDETRAEESEHLVRVRVEADRVRTHLIGPRNPKGGDLEVPLDVTIDRGARAVTIRSDAQGSTVTLREGVWSEWVRVRWKTGLLQAVRGMVRFYLVRLDPDFELYASPVNFDPDAPLFPISSPGSYARDLRSAIGTFYTTGMVEDHGGLNNGRFDESAYLAQCALVMREREQMAAYELDRFREGLFFCLFDTPDRLQHMFWRFREPGHPANRHVGLAAGFERVIEDHYRQCDELVGRLLERADEQTLVVVLSDHGFSSFQRGVHLNAWLHRHGFLVLARGVEPGEAAGDFLKQVDWSRTSAYALGLGSVYLNLAGREGQGSLASADAQRVKQAIAEGLTGLVDPERRQIAVGGVSAREAIYAGAYLEDAPDLIVKFNAGYRASWATALGGVPASPFEDNVKRWGGDHIIDPALVPGVLFMNRPFRTANARLVDLAPTILDALGAGPDDSMEGSSLLL